MLEKIENFKIFYKRDPSYNGIPRLFYFMQLFCQTSPGGPMGLPIGRIFDGGLLGLKEEKFKIPKFCITETPTKTKF